MKIFFLFLLLSFLGFGQITFNEPKTQIKNEVLNLYLDYDNNSFISKQELKFTDFLKLDSERDDNWYSEFKGIYTKKPYEYSGYDLGHLTPSHITSYDNKVNHHSFSFYNQSPQLAGFNRGKWARLERFVEDSISKFKSDVTIITGVIYDNNKKTFLNKSKIKIPISFYKILFIKTKKIIYVWIGSNVNGEVMKISIEELNELLKLNKNDLIFNVKK
jgi:DNA/RNA endonuclease G (NUC1)